MEIAEFLSNPPLLHSWDGGATWNTGGFNKSQLKSLYSYLKSELPANPLLLETGAGNSTITMLYLYPKKLITICPDKDLVKRIKSFCTNNDISFSPVEFYEDHSEWVLPRLAASVRESSPILDFALIDGCHGWPTAFVDLEYINSMLCRGGFLMIDDIQLHSIKQMAKFIMSQPGYYEKALDLGKALVLRKITSERTFGEWVNQPYIVRRTNQYIRPLSLADESRGLRGLAFSSAAQVLARIRRLKI